MCKPNFMKTILQILERNEKDNFFLAKKYYGLLFRLNDLHLTEREEQLVAYVAIRGSLNINVREEFCKMYETSMATINNMISELKKKGVFIKEGGKVKIVPVIALNFENDIVLKISLKHG